MKSHPDCYACTMRRSLLEFEDETPATQYEVVRRLAALYAKSAGEPLTTMELYWRKTEVLDDLRGGVDRFASLKEKSIREAEKLKPILENYISEARNEEEWFHRSLKVALAGNTVEFGAHNHELDLGRLKDHVNELLAAQPVLDDSHAVHEVAKKASSILYITDNAGEVVFDRYFIDALAGYAPVSVAALSHPLQDDATVVDVQEAGIGDTARIIDGRHEIGVVCEKASPVFNKTYASADLVVAKGMACRETIPDYAPKSQGAVCFLYKAKCRPVAQTHGVPLGGLVASLEATPLHPPG